jgi:hypothetical protein
MGDISDVLSPIFSYKCIPSSKPIRKPSISPESTVSRSRASEVLNIINPSKVLKQRKREKDRFLL